MDIVDEDRAYFYYGKKNPDSSNAAGILPIVQETKTGEVAIPS